MKEKYIVSSLAGAKIKKLRKNEGYTVNQLARLIDKSEQQLFRYERGVSKIDLDTIIKCLKVLKTNMTSFFDELAVEARDMAELERYRQDQHYKY
ncbi:helix-turn-helix transcriptional regulator [Moellerella wisconsensis]|uniref:helix-turn-helix domain-containing protein n=1 Tax=Moellerella wisconsensis TaxID=158849 RepID=UPI00307600A2